MTAPVFLLLSVVSQGYDDRVCLGDAARMPLLAVAEENTRFAKAHLDYLDAAAAYAVREYEVAYYHLRREDAHLRWWIWDAVRMAREEKYGEHNRLHWLRYLKRTLTEGEWETGVIRPPAPFHLFTEID